MIALPLVATLLPFRYSTPLAVPPVRVSALLIVAEVEVRFVIVADPNVALLSERLLMVKLLIRATVADRSDTVAVVAIRFVIVALPARSTVAETSAQVRLAGFVPSSTT